MSSPERFLLPQRAASRNPEAFGTHALHKPVFPPVKERERER